MKKRITYLLLAVCMIFTVILPVGAGDYYLVFDEPDLLTESEEAALNARLESIGALYRMEVVVAAFETIDGASPMAYADDFYDYNGYGYGADRDGLILILVMDTSDWWISTCGNAIWAFTDAGIDYIGDQIVPYLSAGDFYGAFDEFADQCEDFIVQYQTGEPYDRFTVEDMAFDHGTAILIALAVGLVIGFFYTASLKGQLKTVQFRREAADYVKKGSMNVTESKDFFLYRKVNRTVRQNNSSSGGSSTHRSSSGTRHGGGGGKF